MQRIHSLRLTFLWLLSVVMASSIQSTSASENMQFDTNDVSFLFPLPTTAEQVSQLIGLADSLDDAGQTLLSQGLFDEVIAAARSVRVNDPVSSETVVIDSVDGFFGQLGSWKIAGIRIDPSAPGCSESIRSQFGSQPQIRLVCQPVLVEDGQLQEVADVSMHLVFDFGPNPRPPFQPDQAAFQAIVNDLVALKLALRAAGVETAGKSLGVHPGFVVPEAKLASRLRDFLKKHLPAGHLRAIAFMGLQMPEPWLFFALGLGPDGKFHNVTGRHASLTGTAAQVIGFITPSPVFPVPNNNQLGPANGSHRVGVSTAQLLAPGNMDNPAGTEPEHAGLQLKHIPDLIAHPEKSHFFTTDCVSCHTESTLRRNRLNGQLTELAFTPPAGISGGDPAALPRSRWNVRNFGWGPEGSGMKATVTMRTVNESAESAAFINSQYLKPATETHSRANALTLILEARDEQAYESLKTKVRGLLANPENPINKALDRLGNVHFARFVFIDRRREVAIITSYDDDFETYIRRFTATIGDIFNLILDHVKDTESMQNAEGKVHVQSHPEQFLEFVKKYDLSAEPPFYSAYPGLSVRDIRQLERQSNE